MKFTLELPILKPKEEVWKAFDNPENLKKWQPSLKKFENIKGVQGQPGAESVLTYGEGKLQFSLIEKVIFRAEPDRFDGVYVNDFADNTVKNTFITTGENETLWKAEVEYVFKTIIMKLVGPMKKKNYVIRAQRDMERFKKFVESR